MNTSGFCLDEFVDCFQKLIAVVFEFVLADAVDFEEGVGGLREVAGHFLQGAVGENDVWRDICFRGNRRAQFAENLE